MAQNQHEPYPELVFQRAHTPGADDEHTFEDTLRGLLHNSPYLGISALVHGIALFALHMMAGTPALADQNLEIRATPEAFEEPIPPEPPPPEEEIEEVDEIIEEPVVSEEVVETDEVVEFQSVDNSFDSTGLNDVIGVGGGGGGNFGKVGRRGSGKKAAGEPLQRAVDDGLRWLAEHQSPDGYWSCAAFDDMCGKLGNDVICDGTGNPTFDVGITGLALLAFLGADHTPTKGKYKNTVKSGLKYLRDVQSSDGNFGIPENGQYTYDHIIATLAMCEAYALTKQSFLKKPAEKGLQHMYDIRNPGAVWRYSLDHPEMITKQNDTSVTGWAIMAMTLAKEYGLEFDEQALEDSMLFIDEMTDPTTGRTGYTEMGQRPPREKGREDLWPDTQTESMTAVGILCRIFADPELERPGTKDMMDKGVKLIERLPPLWDDDEPGRRDFYYWYYASYALYQYQDIDKRPWKAWEKSIETAIAEFQHDEGERKGSWDPQVDPWGHAGGRVYATALNILTLEVYYRYDSVMGSH